VIQILLAHGTDVHTKIADLSATTDAGKTPEEVACTEDLKEMMRSALLRAAEARRAMLEALIMGQHKRLGAAGWTEALGTEAQPLPRVLRLHKRIPDTVFRGRFEGSAQKVYFTQGTDRFSHHQWRRYQEGPLSVGSDLKWERDKSITRPLFP
jgi:hypothetical protein